MTSVSLHLLWQNIKKGNIRSFESLYRLTYKKLSNLIFKIVDNDEIAKDILQECYVSLYQKKDSLPADLNVEAYLYSTVKYSSFKYLRDVLSKKQTLYVSYTAAYDFEDHLPTVEENKTDESRMDSILDGISELPDRCRSAFVLKYFNNMSYKEISQTMAISPKTVEKHVHYGLTILRKKFRKN